MCRDNALHCLSVSDYRSTCSSESKVMTSCTTYNMCTVRIQENITSPRNSKKKRTRSPSETPQTSVSRWNVQVHDTVRKRLKQCGPACSLWKQHAKLRLFWSTCYIHVHTSTYIHLNADSDLANLYLWRTTEAIREEESAISDAVLSLFFSYHGNAEEEQHHYSQYWLISWGTEKSHYTNMITQRRKCD